MLRSVRGHLATELICAKSILSSALIVSSVLCDIHVEYSPRKEALSVSLVGKPFSDARCHYNVSLWSLPPAGLRSPFGHRTRTRDSVLVEPIGPNTTVSFFHVRPHYAYLIKVEQVTPEMQVTNCTPKSVWPQPLYHYIGSFLTRQRRSADCSKWNATINLIPDVEDKQTFCLGSLLAQPYRHLSSLPSLAWHTTASRILQSVIVLFRVLPPYVECFRGYRLYLYRDVPWACSDDVGTRVASKKIDVHNGTITFEHLSPGNYCLRVLSTCPDCGILYSDVVNLLGVPRADVATASNASAQKSESLWSYAALAVAVVVVSVLAGIVVKVLHVRRLARLHACIPDEAGPCHDAEDVDRVHAELKVVILHTPDCELHKAAVLALARFVRECCCAEVILEVLPAVESVSSEWVARQLDCRCKEAGRRHGCNKKVVVVESEGAVKLHQISKSGKMFRPQRPTVFYRVFYNALAVLFSKLDRALADYKHILVVRFPYTPDSARLKYLVPGRRFSLPSHLVELYKALHDVGCDSVSSARRLETELLQKWTDDEASYAALQDAVDEMTAFVSLHPLYLSDVLVEVAV